MTAQTVRVSAMRAADRPSSVEMVSTEGAAPWVAVARIVEAPDDVYVQSVMALFGVKGWRVQQMAAEPISDGEVEPTRED